MIEKSNESSACLPDGAVLRRAERGDLPGLLRLVIDLAVYEREPDAVATTVDDLDAALFGPDPAVFAHVVESEGRIVGIAIWFRNFPTWTGRHGIHLEDLYVDSECRGRGYGVRMLRELARLCLERGYAQLEWNAPSIAFYDALGAVPMDEWVGYRLSGAALEALGS